MRILERWAISICSAAMLMSTGVSADPPASSAPATADASAEQAKLLKSQDYKPEVVRGETVYCRSEAAIGTRFKTKTCASAAEIQRRSVESKAFTDKAQRVGDSPRK